MHCWLSILNGLKNRGVEDILIACVDGLTGFPQAIEAVFPQTEIQHFQETVIRWKYRLGFGDFPELAVKSFNRIRGIDQTSDSFRILKIC